MPSVSPNITLNIPLFLWLKPFTFIISVHLSYAIKMDLEAMKMVFVLQILLNRLLKKHKKENIIQGLLAANSFKI